MAVDNESNIYIAGQTTIGGDQEAFVAKFNVSGHPQWNVTFESTIQDDYGRGITVDNREQAVYLAGYSSDGPHAFLVKYHLNGTFIWSKTYFKGIGDTGHGVVTDDQHNVYLLGTSKFPTPNRDVLLAKYNSTGQLLWDIRWGGSNEEYVGDAVAVGSSGSVYFTCSESIAGYYNIHLVKYTPEGSLIWNKTWDQSDEDVSFSLAVDPNDNVYVGGLTNNTVYDALVIKYGIDSDNDTLTDDLEIYQYGTNRTNADTDSDQIPDGAELLLNLDPLNISDGLADFDLDLLLNYEEYAADTNMTDPDTDSDGLLDGVEVHTYGTDPLDHDTDGDSFSDGVEVAAGTDPLDPTSYPTEGIPSFLFMSVLLTLSAISLIKVSFKERKYLGE